MAYKIVRVFVNHRFLKECKISSRLNSVTLEFSEFGPPTRIIKDIPTVNDIRFKRFTEMIIQTTKGYIVNIISDEIDWFDGSVYLKKNIPERKGFYGDKYDRKLEEFGCNYPQPHPAFCDCKCCKKYKAWLKREQKNNFVT